MPTTSENPEPSCALQPSSTTTPPSVLSQEDQLSLFFIGLEMLGEEKKKRFLSYLLSLRNHEQQNQEKCDEL